MQLTKLAFSTVKPRNALAALTLAGSLCALAPQAYANGIDFDTGIIAPPVFSTSVSTPTILKTVTATCPLSGFLYAMAGTEFNLSTFSTSAKKFVTSYSLPKNSTATDQGTDYELDSLVQVSQQTPDTLLWRRSCG